MRSRRQVAMRWLRAPAKINLTLRVIGRRADGYHELESLVAFAGLCDWIGFEPGPDLVLEVVGPRAVEAGPVDENLVLRAARALAPHVGQKLGRFRLVKRLPAAAGLGGGSADAAAALRLLAKEARLSVDDPRVRAAARATGADVLVCLHPHARMMTGVGDRLGPLIPLPKMFAVLVNPRVQAPTPKVFAALGLAPGSRLESSAQIVRCAWTGCGGDPGFSCLEPKRPRSGGGPHSAGYRRRARADWPGSRRPWRRECLDRERPALPCSAIAAVRLWRGAFSPRNVRTGGSRRPPSTSSAHAALRKGFCLSVIGALSPRAASRQFGWAGLPEPRRSVRPYDPRGLSRRSPRLCLLARARGLMKAIRSRFRAA